MDRKICNRCHNHFTPNEHEQGLVINDSIFICEECNFKFEEDHNSDAIENSITHLNKKEMPIALWLIQEQNKGKQFMSMKK